MSFGRAEERMMRKCLISGILGGMSNWFHWAAAALLKIIRKEINTMWGRFHNREKQKDIIKRQHVKYDSSSDKRLFFLWHDNNVRSSKFYSRFMTELISITFPQQCALIVGHLGSVQFLSDNKWNTNVVWAISRCCVLVVVSWLYLISVEWVFHSHLVVIAST